MDKVSAKVTEKIKSFYRAVIFGLSIITEPPTSEVFIKYKINRINFQQLLRDHKRRRCFSVFRELKQQRRRRLQKRHLKSEFAPLQTLSRLFHLVYFVKCWQMFLELNSKGLYQSSGKEKKVVVLCSCPRQNVNSGTFTL